MKNKTGEIAGKIWKTVGEKKEVGILKLPKILKESTRVTEYSNEQVYFLR